MTIPGAKTTEFIQDHISNYITIMTHLDVYKIRLRYDLDTKQFQEPYTTFDHIQFPINGGRICGFYRENGHELTQHLIAIIGYCYEVSKIKGFGNKYGGDWDNDVHPSILAITEFRRLLDESRKHIGVDYVKN